MVMSQADGAKDAVDIEDAQLENTRNSIANQRSMADDSAARLLASTHVGEDNPD